MDTAEETVIDDAVKSRLSKLTKAWGTQDDLAEATGMSVSTLRKIIQGVTEPGFSKVVRLAQVLEVSLDEIAFGVSRESGDHATFASEDLEPVPEYDLFASAGYGCEALDGPPTGHMGFRKTWITRRFGSVDSLAIIRVRGDSMEPELRDGDRVMIDMNQSSLGDGLFVLTHEGQAKIKRVQLVAKNRLLLLSSNPAYQPEEVRLLPDDSTFQIKGRAVWLGRNL
jgi:phage repressor protein C with HTH and peptisase S24 domain